MACQKLTTAKPGKTAEANNTSKALITKVNKPKVKMLIGKVRRIKIGLITALINPKTTTKINAVQKLAKLTPDKICAAIIIATALHTLLKVPQPAFALQYLLVLTGLLTV